MGKLVYAALASLDGFFEDAAGNFDWAEPDEEVHSFVNDLERKIGVYLYGRRMYEVMAFWETAEFDGEPDAYREYAEVWRAADKVVFSRTLDAVTSARTRLERTFDPELVRALKASSSMDLSIAGGDIAGQAMAAGLVDECHLFLNPVVVGGGKRVLPENTRVELELLDERRFGNGCVYLHYRFDA